ncbi:hypothetical protein CRE_24517 [Caenorhabditis remanei]|uniref:F-box domain-containing protein n=1 Tax=Caenorhabditis remanei TaxID=31234 RepID=E3MG19_CAERE|nr:hypothetical protein CRE_24517 [Caenorhabditis remanei]
MSSSFPLFNLPSEVVLHVIKSMDCFEYITFSFLSERAKSVVKSMNLKALGSTATVAESITLKMSVGHTYVVLEFTKGNQQFPDKFTMRYLLEDPFTEYIVEEHSFKEWMEHCKSIFNYAGFLDITLAKGFQLFDLNEISTIIGSIRNVTISPGVGDTEVEVILKHFPTKPLWFKFGIFEMGAFEALLHPHRILIQNIDNLCIEEVDPQVSLDDLLMANSKDLTTTINMTTKEVNRFIKHWQRGSNPRMECLKIGLLNNEVINKEVILKGVNYAEAPINQVRHFKTISWGQMKVNGGVDFYRNDGTMATIEIDVYEDDTWLTMYVWYPHCVGNAE